MLKLNNYTDVLEEKDDYGKSNKPGGDLMEKLTYTVAEIAELLGIGMAKAYELTHIEGFPKVPLMGRRVVVPKAEFHKWLSKVTYNDEQEG